MAITTTNRTFVLGVFEDIEHANAAIDDLLAAGFTSQDIGFAMRESDDKKEQQAKAYGNAAAARISGGAVAGGVLGGLLGAITAIALPGVGPLLSAGLLLAGGGAIAGGFAGLMSTMELSHEEIHWYQGELQAGRPIVAVRAESRYSEALAILTTHGAYDIARRRSTDMPESVHVVSR